MGKPWPPDPSLHAISLSEGRGRRRDDFARCRRVDGRDNLPSLRRLSIQSGCSQFPVPSHTTLSRQTPTTKDCVSSGLPWCQVLDDGDAASPSFRHGQAICSTSTPAAAHHRETSRRDVLSSSSRSSSERTEDFGPWRPFGAFTDAVLGNTYCLPAFRHREDPPHTTGPQACRPIGDPEIPASAYFTTRTSSTSKPRPRPLNYAKGQARFAMDRTCPPNEPFDVLVARVPTTGCATTLHPVAAEMGSCPTRTRTEIRHESRWPLWILGAQRPLTRYVIPRRLPAHTDIGS